ncbi:NADPH-dependent F420 reductase [Glycomyces tritici]|uniref:Uncharacterized protein n=1 Tax=Glycomyces tritici TaxID=2665176 RepID=A0ABT7YLV7_9ACTN|nr:hypothetical protein [Glycomyces tritici]MDN3239268.1 hypothetical protein [Glycomyces tritici]
MNRSTAPPAPRSSSSPCPTRAARSSPRCGPTSSRAPGARVVKAFNTTFASRLANTGRLDVFIAGDDGDARKTVAALCTDADLRPIDVGGLKHAATLEAMQLLHMKVQGEIDGNWATALAFAS